MTLLRRGSRFRVWRGALLLIAAVIAFDFLKLLSTYGDDRLNGTLVNPEPPQSVYISSIFWNSAAILYSSWNDAVLELAAKLGAEHVYISIYESGSWDESKKALRQLEHALVARGIRHRIILDDTTHEDELARPPASEGWVQTNRGRKQLRRIPYLSRLRNKALEPLAELAANGTTFDKVLFLNDVFFTPRDVSTLLATNAGSYAAACSLDFSKPPSFYDTFALRDSEGHEPLMMTYPYFRSRSSRKAVVANEPASVQSCWNGMVMFDASPFYGTQPLLFRGIPDSLASHHLEGSECCLIHADNPLTATKGVWVNPNVRVGYSASAYHAVHTGEPWPDFYARFVGIWKNRFRRWSTTVAFKEWVVRRRVRDWEGGGNDRHEPGLQCLINEMQVLVHNGWAHV